MPTFPQVLRKNATNPERLLWSRLRKRQLGGFKFSRQRPIGSYICDFVCLSESLIVELDGSQHVQEATYDARRDAILRSNGFRILRFWNGDVFRQLDVVLDTIYAALFRKDMDGRFG